MNYIKHLASFFERVSTDERLNPTHISMYVSLFQFWNSNRFQNPISISRNELMRISKISAKATYHKCIRELNDWQYLKYKPSYNPFKGSLVYLFESQPDLPIEQAGVEQALITNYAENGTSIEQAQEPYINVSKHNKQNVANLGEQSSKSNVQKFNESVSPLIMERGLGGEAEKEKLRQKKKNVILSNVEESLKFKVPELKEVQEYFASQKCPSVEATKFYNYFQSNGWLVGGRTKMKDWQAAARNWMLNANKFNSHPMEGQGVVKTTKPNSKQLHATAHKNYSEPL